MLNTVKCQYGLLVPFFTYRSKLAKSVRMMTRVVWLQLFNYFIHSVKGTIYTNPYTTKLQVLMDSGCREKIILVIPKKHFQTALVKTG